MNNQQPVMEDIKRIVQGMDATARGYKLHEDKKIDRSKINSERNSDKNSEQESVKPNDRLIHNETKEHDFIRGSICYAIMQPSKNLNLDGLRPVIVVSNDVENKYSPTVTVISITSQIRKPKLPTHVALENILEFPSVALAEQVRTIDKSQLYAIIATLDEETLKRIDKALEIHFGFTEI